MLNFGILKELERLAARSGNADGSPDSLPPGESRSSDQIDVNFPEPAPRSQAAGSNIRTITASHEPRHPDAIVFDSAVQLAAVLVREDEGFKGSAEGGAGSHYVSSTR